MKGHISVSRIEGGAKESGKEGGGPRHTSQFSEGAQGGRTRKPGSDSEPWGAEGWAAWVRSSEEAGVSTHLQVPSASFHLPGQEGDRG